LHPFRKTREKPVTRRILELGARVLLGAVVWLCLEASAFAQVTGEIAVGNFRGSKAQALRGVVAEVLHAAGYKVLPFASPTESENPRSDSDYASIAAPAKIRAFVLARTALSKRDWVSTVVIRDGKSGAMLGEFKLVGRNFKTLEQAFRDGFLEQAADLLKQSTDLEPKREPKAKAKTTPSAQAKVKVQPKAEPAPPPEPAADSSSEPASPEQPAVSPVPPAAPAAHHVSALELTLGPSLEQRFWTVNDILPGTLPGRLASFHDVTMFAFEAGLVVYPVALFSDSLLRHIGLEVNYERSLLGKTAINDAGLKEQRDTAFQRLVFGVRVRIPVDILEIAVWGGLGGDSLTLAGEKVVAALPNLSTRYVRMGADLAIHIGPLLTFQLGAGYRHVLDIGDKTNELAAKEWFPAVTGSGIEGRLRGELALAELWRVRLSATGTRDVYAFKPDLGSIEANADAGLPAPPIAGGASDLHLVGTLAAVFYLPAK
jgi:hypothetical protein